MKRLLCVLLIAVLALSAAGCAKIGKIIDVLLETEAPTVTDVPATDVPATDVPATDVPEVTPEPTNEPDVTDEPGQDDPFLDYVMILEDGVTYNLDLDFDGLSDTVLIITQEAGEWGERPYTVEITLGANPGYKLEYEINYCDEFYACVLDSYTGDDRLEVVISFMQDSDDWTTVGFRVNDYIPELDVFERYFCVSRESMLAFTTEKGFHVTDYTDIWGTHSLWAYFKVGQFGFDMVSVDYTYYIYDDDRCAIELLHSLDAYVLNDNGTRGSMVNVSAGEEILPIRTDKSTYVIMKIVSTGQLIIADIEVHSWDDGYDDWGVFISGINQDEYADIMYAD